MAHEEHEKNRIAWNDMVEVHWRHPEYKVREFLDGWNSLHSIEREQLGDVSGKSLLHLQCQFGMDTLSWARLGAEATGVDISDKSIDRARQLMEMSGLRAEFIRSDVFDLIGKIDRKFDIVVQTYGTIYWLRELPPWARVVAHYLKPGGTFLLIDSHPVQFIYDEEDPVTYLERKVSRSTNDPDYCDPSYIIPHELVEVIHPMMDVVNSLIEAGLRIEHLGEYDFDYDMANKDWKKVGDYYQPPDGPPPYPLMFSLRCRQPENRS